MENIYAKLKSLIGQKEIEKAASTLSEKESDVKKAVSAMLPALCGKLVEQGDTDNVREVLEEAGKNDLFSHISELFDGHGIVNNMNFGERMENALIGSTNSEFPAAVASASGIKAENADRLGNWVSGTIAGYVGKLMVKDKQPLASILGQLKSEIQANKSDIPSKLYSALGLASVFGAHTASHNANTTAKRAATTAQPKKKRSYAWIWWILLLILLILLFCWWRSCDRKKDAAQDATAAKTEQVSEKPADVKHTADNMV